MINKVRIMSLVILLVIILVGTTIYFIFKDNFNKTTYDSNVNTDNNISNSNDNQDIINKLNILSTFTTSFKGSPKNRIHNITLASSKINNIILNPGDVFSFNTIVGPTSKKQGYKKADVFDSNGKTTQDYGGGICQVSSTIYNAALALNLEIVERHEHSKPVSYVEDGKDATVSYSGLLDFSFKNILTTPIQIMTIVSKDNLTVNIIGK